MRRHALFAVLLASVAGAGVSAAPIEVPFDAFSLAEGRIEGGGAALQDGVRTFRVATDAGDETACPLRIESGSLFADGDKDSCRALWAMRALRPLTLEADAQRIRLVPAAQKTRGGVAAEVVQGGLKLADGGVKQVAVYSAQLGSMGWDVKDVIDGVVKLDELKKERLEKGQTEAFAKDNSGQTQKLMVKPAAQKERTEGSASTASMASSDARPKRAPQVTLAKAPEVKTSVRPPPPGCPPEGPERSRYHVLCVDALDQVPELVAETSDGLIIKPNTQILVMALHREDLRPTLTLTGDRGLFRPTVKTETIFPKEAGKSRGTPTAKAVWAAKTFAPRKPGNIDLTVTFTDKEGKKVSERTFELIVETTYAGSIRLGVGIATLGAVDAAYALQPLPGGTQGEIRAQRAAPFDAELVLGFSPYLEPEGRSARGCDWRPFCFSPYIGLGVAAPKPDGTIDFLKSLHLGVEWEPTPTISIAATVVGRRVDRLAPGFKLGGAAPVGVPILQQSYGVGFGLVLNLSPGFFKMATGGDLGLSGLASSLGGLL